MTKSITLTILYHGLTLTSIATFLFGMVKEQWLMAMIGFTMIIATPGFMVNLGYLNEVEE